MAWSASPAGGKRSGLVSVSLARRARAKWAIATIVLVVLVDLVFILLNISGRRRWSSSS